ncbi:DUF2795 domain-containing protein [Pseudonocardia xishanensis]|uniref:DUF2795 domain-containing protein n=1 Tax=Pseudonocardia xishanensis TaxID=630995 RepID=A0ABP8S305_9PSEU
MPVTANEMQNYLAGAMYPAEGPELAVRAERNGAPPEVVERIREMPSMDGADAVLARIPQD